MHKLLKMVSFLEKLSPRGVFVPLEQPRSSFLSGGGGNWNFNEKINLFNVFQVIYFQCQAFLQIGTYNFFMECSHFSPVRIFCINIIS